MESNILGSHSKRVYYEAVYREGGTELWREEIGNLVPSAALDAGLDSIYGGTGFTAYVALVSGTPTFAAADTLASHSGWTEATNYSGNRPAVTWAAASGGVKSNTNNPVSITFSSSGVIGGIALVSATSGTSGLLDSEAAFGTAQTVAASGVLDIVASVTATTA